MPKPIIRSRGIRMSATGLSPPPGSLVRARRMAPPSPRCSEQTTGGPSKNLPGTQQRLGRRDVEPGEQDAVVVSRCAG